MFAINMKLIGCESVYRWVKDMDATGMDAMRMAIQGLRSGGTVDELDASEVSEKTDKRVMRQAGLKSKKILQRYNVKRTAALMLKAALVSHDVVPPLGLCDARGAR